VAHFLRKRRAYLGYYGADFVQQQIIIRLTFFLGSQGYFWTIAPCLKVLCECMRKILEIFLCIFLASCSYGYKLKNSQVYWTYSNESVGNAERLLDGVDAKSLQTFGFKAYAKDKNHAYYEGVVIDGADANTFRPIDNNYAVDNKKAYISAVEIKGADGGTFSLIEGDWSKDKSEIYYLGDAVGVCDFPTFRVKSGLDGWWAEDAKCVYHTGKRLPIKDRDTFEIIDEFYSRDKYLVYCLGKIIEGADPETFRIIKNKAAAAEDKYSCYRLGDRVECGK